MEKKDSIKIFEDKKVRAVWDSEQEKWYLLIVDVIKVLTDQNDFQGARNYWKVLKHRLLKDGNETVTNCNRLKLLAEDGKMRSTDVADTEQRNNSIKIQIGPALQQTWNNRSVFHKPSGQFRTFFIRHHQQI
jgi:hypothetical protein